MSSDTAMVRTRVLRGDAAQAVRASLDADLTLNRPTRSLVDPVAAAAQAEQSLRQARNEAARAGYEDGYAAGMAAAAADAAVRSADERAALDAALTAVERAAADLAVRQAGAVADVEQRVAHLAVQIAEAILDREIALSPTTGRDAIQRALRLAPAGADVVARLNPADLDTVGEIARLTDRTVTVVPDPAVEHGGCVVETGPCRIDAQIAPALARVREVLGA